MPLSPSRWPQALIVLAIGAAAAGIASLKRAYETLPHPNVAYNLGRAHAEAGDVDEAIGWYRVYLMSSPADRYEIETVIRALERHRERRKWRMGVMP